MQGRAEPGVQTLRRVQSLPENCALTISIGDVTIHTGELYGVAMR